jgi:hypothetical protein
MYVDTMIQISAEGRKWSNKLSLDKFTEKLSRHSKQENVRNFDISTFLSKIYTFWTQNQAIIMPLFILFCTQIEEYLRTKTSSEKKEKEKVSAH